MSLDLDEGHAGDAADVPAAGDIAVEAGRLVEHEGAAMLVTLPTSQLRQVGAVTGPPSPAGAGGVTGWIEQEQPDLGGRERGEHGGGPCRHLTGGQLRTVGGGA